MGPGFNKISLINSPQLGSNRIYLKFAGSGILFKFVVYDN